MPRLGVAADPDGGARKVTGIPVTTHGCDKPGKQKTKHSGAESKKLSTCLLYTSDAADE